MITESITKQTMQPWSIARANPKERKKVRMMVCLEGWTEDGKGHTNCRNNWAARRRAGRDVGWITEETDE